MMTAPSKNRSMFRRLVRRLLFANRGRLFVVLLALSAGAAVSAALLNLQVDAKRRLNTAFDDFGYNLVLTPKDAQTSSSSTIDETIRLQLPSNSGLSATGTPAAFLYVLADAQSVKHGTKSKVIVVGGRNSFGDSPESDSPAAYAPTSLPHCFVGRKAAQQLGILANGEKILLKVSGREEICKVEFIFERGEAIDSQIWLHLDVAQRLAALPGRASLIQLRVRGDSETLDRYAGELRQKFPDFEIRPLHQFTEAQAKIYSRISGLLTAATAIILVLTALCVMAAMTNVAAERKHDVGMMKAIGGSARSILNLFLTEAVLLGLLGGLIGATAGIGISIGLGKAVFGVAAAPRFIVYPIAVSLTVIVAILGAYPLRMLANVRPATIFRGEA